MKKKSYMDISNILPEGKLRDLWNLLKMIPAAGKEVKLMNKSVAKLEKIMANQSKKVGLKPVKLPRFELSDFIDKKK